MKIAFNPSTVAALTTPPNNKDITFDLRGRNIFARGVKFCGTDTNTWRDIKINNVSIGSNILDLRNGSNTTLTNTNGVVTINSTWRPVVDNLTSDSTTSSLSANQGRVLKALINGKSDTGHTHDDRYLKLIGGTMLGALNFANNTWNKVGNDVYIGDHNIGGQLCIMGANGTTGLSFHKYGDASIRKSITFDGNTLYMNGSCDYATLSNQTNLLAINTVPNKTAATSIGSWSPINGRYVFHQKWTDTSTGSDSADFGIYLDGNLTANMVLDGYYNSLLGFRVIGATGGFLKANGTIDHNTYLTSHQSLSNYYTKGEVDSQLSKYKLKSSIWVPETKIICSNFRDFLNKENLHKQAPEELNLYRFFAAGDESNYSSKYNYPVVDSHAMVFSIDGNNGYIRSMNFDLRSNDVYVTSRVANGEWRSWVRLLNTSDVAGLKNDLTVYQYLSNTDTTWWPLIWGGSSHNNTSNFTGAVYKSYDKLSWQTSSQTLYATNIQTNNIKNLSVGGGIYWNPYVKSTTDGSDAASITLVRQGVAGGTTLVLSQMNDANDTIQFQTNGSARLYHNSYPILTTQNTYVSNNRGYINNTEITQVNNADTVDGVHLKGIFTAFQANGNATRLVIGGVTKDLTIPYSIKSNQLYSYSLPYTSYDKVGWYCKIASVSITALYSSKTALLCITDEYTTTSSSARYGLIYIKMQQQRAFGSSPNVVIRVSGSLTTSLVTGILTLSSTTSKLDIYLKEDLQHQRGYISFIQGAQDIRTNSQELIQTLPSGTIINSQYGDISNQSVSLLNSYKINGTSFNGTSDITTAYWGATRTISLIGAVTGSVSTNGSDNITINTTYGTENITNLDSRYLKRTGDTMSGTLSFSPNDTTDAAPKIYSTVSDLLTSLNFEVSDDTNDRFVFRINYHVDTNATNRERFTIDWNNVISKAPITAPSFNGNATSATKLQTSRLLWGQPFGGTGNVDNTLRIKQTTGNYCEGIRIQTADNAWSTIILGATGDSGTNANAWSIHRKSDNNFAISRNSSDGVNGLVMTSTGMGLGTTAPTQRLDVAGNIRATGNSYATHFYESSDKTLKKNIKSILSSTNIPKIREFDWKDTGEHSYGFIAQELEEQGYGCLVNEADGKKTVNYTATLALTVAKLQNLINIQNKKISNLTKELKALKYGRKKNS